MQWEALGLPAELPLAGGVRVLNRGQLFKLMAWRTGVAEGSLQISYLNRILLLWPAVRSWDRVAGTVFVCRSGGWWAALSSSEAPS